MHVLKKLLYIFLILFIGCSDHSTADLIIPPPDIVRYSEDVLPIVSANCIQCHNDPPLNGVPNSLKSYEQVRTAIVEHGLLDRISRPQGEPGMMPSGGSRLPQPAIDILFQWEADGFPQ